MKFHTDGHLIEMVELNGIWTPVWMAEEIAAGRYSELAGREVERVNGAIPLSSGERSGFKEPKLLTSGSLEESGGSFEGEREEDGRALHN